MQLIRQLENSLFYSSGSTMARWACGSTFQIKEYSLNMCRTQNFKQELIVEDLNQVGQNVREKTSVKEINLNGKKIDILMILGDEASYNIAMQSFLTDQDYLIHFECDPLHR